MPPFNINVYDRRLFGRRPLIGTHVIHSIDSFRREPLKGIPDLLYQYCILLCTVVDAEPSEDMPIEPTRTSTAAVGLEGSVVQI